MIIFHVCSIFIMISSLLTRCSKQLALVALELSRPKVSSGATCKEDQSNNTNLCYNLILEWRETGTCLQMDKDTCHCCCWVSGCGQHNPEKLLWVAHWQQLRTHIPTNFLLSSITQPVKTKTSWVKSCCHQWWCVSNGIEPPYQSIHTQSWMEQLSQITIFT